MNKRTKLCLALLILITAAAIGTREYQNRKIDNFNPNGVYIDTLLQDHGRLEPITSDTATPETKRDYDSSVKAQEAVDSAWKEEGRR